MGVVVEWIRGNRQPADEHAAGDVPFSISDKDALAEYLGISSAGLAGVAVTERTAFGLTVFHRCVSLIAGSIASLPLKTYRRLPGDRRERVPSFLDTTPAGPYKIDRFSWTEMLMTHLLTRGETFLQHIYANSGALIGLWPTHPTAVSAKWIGPSKEFTVASNGSTRTYTSDSMTQIMGLTTDGLRGISPLSAWRTSIGTAIAGDRAAARIFGNGLLIGGVVSPKNEDISEPEAQAIKKGLSAKVTGIENAGDVAVVNKALEFHKWSMSLEDAQFIQGRQFQVEDMARAFGIPPHLVGAVEKQTSWGTGIKEQNLGLARYTLMNWTGRVESALSTLLPPDRFVEFDYAGFLQGSPEDEIKLLIEQVKNGLLTVDEARAIRNLPPKPVTDSPSGDTNA